MVNMAGKNHTLGFFDGHVLNLFFDIIFFLL